MRKQYTVVISTAILLIIFSVGSVLLISHLSAPKISINIDSNGRLYVRANVDTKNMCIYWETDAGSIKPVVINDDLKYQPDNAYFCITAADEAAVWDIKDHDGNDYSSATIRAYLYKPDENNTKYYLKKTIGSDEITIKKVGGTVRMADKRIFGNQVRADGQTEWGQIIPIYETSFIVMLCYRTGTNLDKKDIIQWESNSQIICKYKFDGLPLDSIESLVGTNFMKKTDTIVLCFDIFKDYNYLDEETNETTITAKAYIYNKKIKKHETQFSYVYNPRKRT